MARPRVWQPKELTCPTCGIKFTPKTWSQYYCSALCWKKGYRKNGAIRPDKKIRSWTPEMVVEAYRQGKSIETIMIESGDSCYYIYKCLREGGIKTRPFHGLPKPLSINTDLTEGEIGYLAGIFDGEGSISSQVVISNTYEELVRWLEDRVGGHVASKVPKKKYRRSRKVLYDWRLSRRADVKAFLDMVMPYLIVKRNSAKELLQRIKEKEEENANK